MIKASGTAHAKVILTGEHAVVHHEPAIALPFPVLTARAAVEPGNGEVLFTAGNYCGSLQTVPARLKGLALCIEKTLKFLRQPCRDLHIKLESDIPTGRGLGSSAATAVAVVRGLARFFRCPLSHKELTGLANVAEKYAHGSPSGIDLEASVSRFPIYFIKGRKPERLVIRRPFYLAVADTGKPGNTKLAVNSILEKRKTDPVRTGESIRRLGQLTVQAKDALREGNVTILGRLIDSAQTELRKLGVSDNNIDYFVRTAKQSGALGAKLTGGGRGGCIIALAENKEHAVRICDALLFKGAGQTWFFQVEKSTEELE